MGRRLFFSLVPLVVLLSFLVATMADPSRGKLWNIDCGASSGYNTPNGLSWVGDGDYVRTGESHVVESASTMTQRMQTVRSFPTGKKNCFTVPVGANTKIRVTLDFFYGNYDNQSSPPSFNLMFDTYDLGVFETRANLGPNVYQFVAVNYVTRRSNTSICFGRAYDDQVPFVSAIQVSALDPGMYPLVNSSNEVLEERRRLAFGANTPIRYPDDPYDRLWRVATAASEGFNYTSLVNNGTGILNTSSSVDNPPPALFHTAAAPPEGERNLTIRAPYIANEVFYLNMYFSELSDLSTSKAHRSFNIYFNDALLNSDPVVPPFNDVLELSYRALASTSTQFSLVPADNTSLPPIISGFELLRTLGLMTSNGTDNGDVEALTILQYKFQVLQNWTGDPCLPETFNWEWVTCNTNEPPRITALSLGGYALSGTLPNFRGLDALETIDLHNNSLTGEIPAFLGELPNLKKLNLADNNFSKIPPSLDKNPKIKLNISGNPLLDHSKAPPPSSTTPPSDVNGCNKFSGSVLLATLLALVTVVIA